MSVSLAIPFRVSDSINKGLNSSPSKEFVSILLKDSFSSGFSSYGTTRSASLDIILPSYSLIGNSFFCFLYPFRLLIALLESYFS